MLNSVWTTHTSHMKKHIDTVSKKKNYRAPGSNFSVIFDKIPVNKINISFK